ncbi:hypothetical protein [Tenacibaculum sp. 190524A02b]|uniref:hypothetical protein n=1 Tax=Tenacibaculum vairaonense TaxID=3137860 RepID=UPI0031FA716D
MEQTKETLKQFFETGDKPTQQQYADLIDSYVDAKQPEGEPNRRFVIDETGKVTVAPAQEIPEYDISNLEGNTLVLLKNGKIVKKINLSSYIDDTNLARLVSGKVDKNGMATFTRDDDSTFTVDFSSIVGGNVQQIQANWQQTDKTQPDFIKNKPNLNLTGGFPPNFYEEGLFDASITTQGATYEFVKGSCHFTRVGNSVTFNINLVNINTKGSPTGQLLIEGLPFLIFNSFDIDYVNIPIYTTGGDVPFDSLRTAPRGSHSFSIFKHTKNTVGSHSPYEKVTFSDGTLRISGTYQTNVFKTQQPNG